MGTITIQRASGFWLYLPSYVKGAWRGHTGAPESVLSQPSGADLADFRSQPQSARHQQQGQTHHWPSSSPQKTSLALPFPVASRGTSGRVSTQPGADPPAGVPDAAHTPVICDVMDPSRQPCQACAVMPSHW